MNLDIVNFKEVIESYLAWDWEDDSPCPVSKNTAMVIEQAITHGFNQGYTAALELQRMCSE